jgi:hypothetical protein
VSALVGCQKSIRFGRCPLWEISHTNDPDASGYQAGAKAVNCPKSEPSERVGVRVRVLDAGRDNQMLNGDSGLVDSGEQKEVPESGGKGKVGLFERSRPVEAKELTRRALIAKQSA